MNLSTVLRIIVSCLLNAVVAWTVDYYATSLLSRRDVFKTGRKPKIFTVQWLAFTLMLCGFALLPSGLNEVGKFSVICGKVVCYIVLFELLYEGSFLKKLLMAVGHSVIMLGGEFIMYRAFIAAGLNPSEYLRAHGLVQHVVSVFISMPVVAAGLAMRRVPNMWFGSITGVQKLKLSLLPILSAVLMILFLLIAFKIVPLVSTVSGIADTVRAAYDTEHRFSVPPPFRYFRCTKTNGRTMKKRQGRHSLNCSWVFRRPAMRRMFTALSRICVQTSADCGS